MKKKIVQMDKKIAQMRNKIVQMNKKKQFKKQKLFQMKMNAQPRNCLNLT